jgi:TonB family protein
MRSPIARVLRAALVACLLLGAPAAAAQDATPPAPPDAATVVPPRLLEDPGVGYPQGALEARSFDEVTVDLVLQVDAGGAVQAVTVASPPRPFFDEAAEEAARRLRFAPATRGGAPIAARIRYRYFFRPPPPGLRVRVVDRATGAAVSGARLSLRGADGSEQPAQTDGDGRFTAASPPRGAARVAASADGYDAASAEVELVPGVEANVVLRLERAAAPADPAQPAPIEVTVQGERLAPATTSFTRGEVRQLPGAFGDPFRAIESLPGVTPVFSGLPFFYIRGSPPGNAGYFFDGVRVPYLFHVGLGPSVIQPALVERVDLYPGGYPARFGRFAGGIVSAEATAPSTELHGEGVLRLFDAGGMVESGFAGGRGTALVGGRYSYTAGILSLVVPELTLDYRDYQARVTYDVTSRDRLTLFAFGAYDLMGQEDNEVLTVFLGSEFYRLDLRHDHDFGDAQVRTAVTLGYESARYFGQPRSVGRTLGVRTEIGAQLGESARLRMGGDVVLDAFDADADTYIDPEDPEVTQFQRLYPARNDVAASAYTDVVLDVGLGMELTPGLRMDVYRSGAEHAVALEPRLAARIDVTDDVRIVHAYGLAHQPPSSLTPGVPQAYLRGGLQRALQASAGVELDLPEEITASGTVFYHAYFGMADALGGGAGDPTQRLEERADGSAQGFELMVRRRLTKRLGGHFAYTLSRSTRTIGRERFPSSYDRTHVANLALSLDLGRGWRAGTRLVFYTGAPEPSADGDLLAERSSSPPRGDPFFRVDGRLEKRWTIGHSGWLAFVAEVLNATLTKDEIAGQTFGPLTIPSLGLEGGF